MPYVSGGKGSAFQARFYVLFQMAHDDLGHSQLMIGTMIDIMNWASRLQASDLPGRMLLTPKA